MIKAVFFDYDGVLTRDATGSLTTCRHLSQATGIAFDRLKRAFQRYNADLTLGRLTHAQVWPAICEAVGMLIPFELLADAFASTPPNTEMFELARRLKTTYAVGIITDNKKDRIDHLRVHQDLGAVFNPIVVSAEVHCAKEDTAIFERALDLAGALPQESIFIDNNRANLIAPVHLGMNAIYFETGKGDVPSLVRHLQEAYGVSVPDGAA